MSLLSRITNPADLKGLSPAALRDLAKEIRAFLIGKVSDLGGHLGSLRQAGGLSGYPSRTESVHDVIENSHASAALSYADGLTKAFALQGSTDRRVVAIVGDGALTGGMCWEALNNLGVASGRPVIIVLNDNGRSYSPTVGGLASHLAELRHRTTSRHTVFEGLGLAYLGPVDGHDIAEIETALRQANELHRPVVVHCVTRKGSGYPPAEQDDTDHLHTVGVIDPSTGLPRCPGSPTWTSVFSDEITAIGAQRPDVVCVTAAMLHPTGLGKFAARFPNRVFDVGIAEQHAITCAAGLALGGLHPVVALYSTFVSRAFDQLLMDVALHRLPVTVVLDRAGITGPDGPSHHGMWDSSILPVVTGLRIAAPRDCTGLRELLREAIGITDGPTVIRYPKATAGPGIPAVGRIGQCDVLRDDPGAIGLLVGVGALAGPCLTAAEELSAHNVPVTVVNPRWIAPVDPALLTLAGAHRLVLTVEDTTTTGALGARIAQALAAAGSDTCAATFALPPRFLPHATRDQTLQAHGLDGVGIATAVLKRLASTHRGKVTTKEVP
jgi:1-deoxy-D-xylulose-5-phosphate synthase